MINLKGITQNNGCAGKFLRELKTSQKQYKLLTKEEERKIVDEYVEPMKYADGTDVLDMTDPLYVKWALESDDNKRRNLYYRCRRVLNWKKSQKEFCDLMVMHQIRFVFNIAQKYNKNTRDYDNMISRGLFGLVTAADRFNPFAPMTRKNPDNPNDKNDKIVVFDSEGKIIPIKFCTYAKNWIFKYVVGEFLDRTLIHIDNNSISMQQSIRTKGSQESKQTVDNYVDGMLAPEIEPPKSVVEHIEDNENEQFYEKLGEYLKNTNELTAMEKEILIDSYYNNMKNREIAEKINESVSIVQIRKSTALKKMKTMLTRDFKINSLSQIFS